MAQQEPAGSGSSAPENRGGRRHSFPGRLESRMNTAEPNIRTDPIDAGLQIPTESAQAWQSSTRRLRQHVAEKLVCRLTFTLRIQADEVTLLGTAPVNRD